MMQLPIYKTHFYWYFPQKFYFKKLSVAIYNMSIELCYIYNTEKPALVNQTMYRIASIRNFNSRIIWEIG